MSPAQIKLAIAAAALLLAFGGGWAVNGWRLGTEVATLQGTVDTQLQSIDALKGANKRCEFGVAEVKTAVQGIADESARRSAAAQVAMEKAARDASGHLAAAKAALQRPPAKKGEECATVAREAVDYARRRRGQP